MPSPPIQLFLTTIASQASLRQRQEYILRILQVRKINFISYDLASDENAKKLWRRKVPPGKQELPGILVGGQYPGTFSEFEEAVEYGELETFLRLNETWDEELEGRSTLEAQPIGVPGASSPSQMTKQRPSFAASPSPLKSKGKEEKEIDVGTELVGFGLQGVKVTDDELLQLVEELGLGDAEAADLVKNLGRGSDSKDGSSDSKDVLDKFHPEQNTAIKDKNTQETAPETETVVEESEKGNEKREDILDKQEGEKGTPTQAA